MFKIALLYPHILNLQGDFANYQILENLAGSADIETKVTVINTSTQYNFLDFDVVLVAAGEVAHFEYLRSLLEPHLEELRSFIAEGKVLLVTGTSIALFGQEIVREDNSTVSGLGLIPVRAKERKMVYGDDCIGEVNYMGVTSTVVGAQINLLDFTIDYSDVEFKPFTKLLYGYGNNGQEPVEGLLWHNAIFSNLHGPLLSCNPQLAWCMLEQLTGKDLSDKRPDFSYSNSIVRGRKNYILNKHTELINCNKQVLENYEIVGR